MSTQNISDKTKIMKKRWFFILAPCAVLLLTSGIWIGTKIDVEQLNNQNNYSSSIKRTIAVVNQDTGVKNGDETVNYSEAFIASLSNDYKVVSYKEAQEGISNGEFSATVTFPSDLSRNVYSINESALQSPKIEFSVNPSLTESGYIETYLKVLNLQNEINETLSYLYVSSVYDEFHSAQDEIKEIFENDEDDMAALENVKLHDFRLDVNWSDIPEVEFNPTEINFEEFVSAVQGYADDMSQKYIDSYAVAQEDYEVFQGNFSLMANTVSDSGLQWYDKVYDREQNVSSYANSVREYKGDITVWQENVADWNASTSVWNYNIGLYLSDVVGWKDATVSWKGSMDDWSSGFIADMNLYKDSITSYRNSVDVYSKKAYDHYVTSTADWALQYTEYADNTKIYLQSLQSYAEDYNNKVIIDNEYVNTVSEYKTELSEYHTNVSNYASTLYSGYFEPLKSFHLALYDTYFGIENDKVSDGLIYDVNAYYESLLQYENALNVYKECLDDYAVSYGNDINYYWQQISLGNTYIQQPVFNLNDAMNQSGADAFDFSAMKMGIRNNQDKVNAYTENKINSLNLTKDQLETDFIHLQNSGQILVPEAPDDFGVSEDGTIEQIDTSILNAYVNADFEEWNYVFSEEAPNPNDYIVMNVKEAPTGISDFTKEVPAFDGGACPTLKVNEPTELKDELPVVPEEFVSNCNMIVDESGKYVPTSYLNEDTKTQVNSVVDTYATNLTTVNSRLTNNMNSNNNLLKQAYNSYNSYVTTLRSDADTAYINKENDLDNTLDIFYQSKDATSTENKELLEDFSEKLPNSRVNSVTNKDLVNFMISPVDMIAGEIRSSEHTNVSLQETRLDLYGLIIAASAALLLVGLFVILMLYRRDAKKWS